MERKKKELHFQDFSNTDATKSFKFEFKFPKGLWEIYYEYLLRLQLHCYLNF